MRNFLSILILRYNSLLEIPLNGGIARQDSLSSCCRYLVKEMLGQGTFGQVVKCSCEETGDLVAVKVIKNQDAFYQQARNFKQNLNYSLSTSIRTLIIGIFL